MHDNMNVSVVCKNLITLRLILIKNICNQLISKN